MEKSLIRKIILEALDPDDIKALTDPKNTPEARKKVYKKLVKKYHPDKGGSDEDMKELNTLNDELENPQGQTSQGSSDGFDWYRTPKMPSDFSDTELKAKIKDAITISGPYGFSELYAEFLRRRDPSEAKLAIDRYNKVNTTTFQNPEDIKKKENNIAHFRIAFGRERGNRVSFDCIYKSLRMLQEASAILSSEGLGSLGKALKFYKIGAQYSPLKITSKGRKEIQDSIEAFEEIVNRMSLLKRLKYMWLGAKKSEKEEMHALIRKVSSLNSVEAFGSTLYHLILK